MSDSKKSFHVESGLGTVNVDLSRTTPRADPRFYAEESAALPAPTDAPIVSPFRITTPPGLGAKHGATPGGQVE